MHYLDKDTHWVRYAVEVINGYSIRQTLIELRENIWIYKENQGDIQTV